MAPYSSVVLPPEPVPAEKSGSQKTPVSAGGTPEPPPRGERARLQVNGNHSHALFAETLLDMSTTRPGRRIWDFFLSISVHFFVVSLLILFPLIYTEAIDLRQFTQTLLVAPPPPPPPPPPPAAVVAQVPRPVKRLLSSGKLTAPAVIPKHVAMLKEEVLPPEPEGFGVMGGVPGGVPGGQAGGVLGGILGGIPGSTALPPKPAAPKTPLRVGGRVKEPRALVTPQPVYPMLARNAKIQGDVLIDAVIDATGNVVEMRAVSGHPLLIPSALQALSQWRFEPTYLNDEPIAVKFLVTIRFRLE